MQRLQSMDKVTRQHRIQTKWIGNDSKEPLSILWKHCPICCPNFGAVALFICPNSISHCLLFCPSFGAVVYFFFVHTLELLPIFWDPALEPLLNFWEHALRTFYPWKKTLEFFNHVSIIIKHIVKSYKKLVDQCRVTLNHISNLHIAEICKISQFFRS